MEKVSPHEGGEDFWFSKYYKQNFKFFIKQHGNFNFKGNRKKLQNVARKPSTF